MKRSLLLAFFLSSLSSFSLSVQADDACEAVLCMFGKMEKSAVSECASAEKEFFSINVFEDDDDEKFDAEKTLEKRQEFLQQCKDADKDTISKILDNFGRKQGSKE
ncbi:TrbM/KikA/MpfK family conjugal transfer protein [Candidatus Regiella endosymbiont of Tuberolachnus salignus]|uniref:TrbM/KikA/MpfK family conjugal transfer protein n=1 Tax=Candidatus Regiella endosymbiont of Tuberolachnus salignus TaxID=3077956 RepID=UPI0030D3ADEC